MSTLTKQMMLSAIDSSANAAKSLINSFDWDDLRVQANEVRKTIQKKSGELLKSVQDIISQARFNEDKTEYTVSVPYDKEAGDKVQWKVEGNVLHIKVSRSDERQMMKSEYAESIPEGFDTKPCKKFASKAKKTASFVFKSIDNGEEFEEVD